MRVTRVILALTLALALAAGGFGFGRRASAAGTATVDPDLRTALATVTEPVMAIVTFHGEGAPTAAQVNVLKQAGIANGVTFQSLPMAGALITPGQLDALAASPDVRSVYLNKQLQYYNAEATALTGVDHVRSDADMTARNGGMPITGKGVAVVINDSGVDGTHKDIEFGRHLVQNVVGTTNLSELRGLLPVVYAENVPNSDTNSGHGTHVAGIVGGTGAQSGGKYEGVAPGASLVGYGSGGALFIFDGLGGFDYGITHQTEYGVRVITNSWGSSAADFDPEDPINIASYLAFKRNIVVTFAAGNAGPGANTHNPYAKAPWVISVAAGDKQGLLADFSSRGTKGKSGTFKMGTESWTWEDRPTITAPGVDIISTRTAAPVSSLSAEQDALNLAPAEVPFYTHMSGTSMATPHLAGIVALMLEANRTLTPTQVKQILQDTATNMPGRETWEVGAGYVNAYAAVDRAYGPRPYGSTLNPNQTFHSSMNLTSTTKNFSIDYNPATPSRTSFTVAAGTSNVVVAAHAGGLADTTGNPLNLILKAPDGTEYSSGVSLLFPLYMDRTVSVDTPLVGTWTAELRGLRGDAANPTNGAGLPQTVDGTITQHAVGNPTGLNDIAGHPAEGAIKMGVALRLFDGLSGGGFRPNAALERRDLARYLVMGANIRQYLPANGSRTFSDVSAADWAFAEAVAANGAALRDRGYMARGVLLPTSAGRFEPTKAVRRSDLAYAFVQSMGLEAEATSRAAQALTVQYGSSRIPIDDAANVPADQRGHVQIALDLNMMNAYFTVVQGPFDLQPTAHASFKPAQTVTRGEFAVAMTRFYNAYLTQ